MPQICTKCKIEKKPPDFCKDKNRPNGFNPICKECINISARARYERNKAKLSEVHKTYNNSPRGKYNWYRRNALNKNIEFHLTFEEFMSFWNLSCSYCGDAIITIRLDRVDNAVGYDVENVVSCCWPCNSMKRCMTKDEFISQCDKIASRNLIKGY